MPPLLCSRIAACFEKGSARAHGIVLKLVKMLAGLAKM
jgi:hypothetical protein